MKMAKPLDLNILQRYMEKLQVSEKSVASLVRNISPRQRQPEWLVNAPAETHNICLEHTVDSCKKRKINRRGTMCESMK